MQRNIDRKIVKIMRQTKKKTQHVGMTKKKNCKHTHLVLALSGHFVGVIFGFHYIHFMVVLY